MSVPIITYSCSACDLCAGTAMLWGERYYLVDRKRYRIQVGVGWCDDCATLVPMEELPEAGVQEPLEQAVQELHVALLGQRSEDRTRRCWWQFFGGDSSQAKKLKFKLADAREELARWRVLFSQRTSSNRCLRCCSEKVFLLPPSPVPLSFDDSMQTPVGLGCQHPGCGGEFMVHSDGTRFVLRSSSTAYDSEGRQLDPRR